MTRREHFNRSMAICRSNVCGHWGADAEGRIGCLLHPKCPGKIDVHLINGGGCLADPKQFDRLPKTKSVRRSIDPMVRVQLPEESIDAPTSDRVVVMIAPGPDYEAQAEITAPLARAYAERIGADFRLLTEDRHPAWPMANKYRFTTYARAYPRSLLVDCDIVIRPQAPDIFEHVSAETFGIFDETPQLEAHTGLEWINREGLELCRSQRIRPPDSFRMFNAGVLVCSQAVAHLYDPPKRSLRPFWCAEQQYLTLLLQEQPHRWRNLDRRFNWTFIQPEFWRDMETAWFVHANGSKPLAYRLDLLKRIASGNFERMGLPPSDWQPRWL